MNSITAALKDTVIACNTGVTLLKTIKWRQFTFDAPTLYIQIFNAAAADVVLGTTAPQMVVKVAAGETDRIMEGKVILEGAHGGTYLGTGLSYACTTTHDGSTAPDAGDEPWVRIDYQPLG